MDPIAAELDALSTLPSSDAAIARALAVCASGEVRTATAQRAAAAVLCRSMDEVMVRKAHELALLAMRSERDARTIAAFCHDRLRVLAGGMQKFGTQRGEDGALLPVDPATTDSERAKWGLPTLRQLAQQDGGRRE